MHRMLAALCVVTGLLFAAPETALAQQGAGSDQTYSRGRVIMKDLTRYEAQDIRFSPDTLSFVDAGTGKAMSVPLTDVEYVSRKKSDTLLGALIGGGTMALISVAAVAEVGADPNRQLKSNAGTILLGFIAGGTVVGALIGSAISNEKPVWEKGRFRVSLAVPLTIEAMPRGAGVTVARVQVAF